MDIRVPLAAAVIALSACGGGGSAGVPSMPPLSEMSAPPETVQASACAIRQAKVLVEEIHIRQAGAPDITVTLPQPRPVDLLDPGTGVLEALQVAPLTHDATELRLRTAHGSTVRLEDGTQGPLRVPGNLRLVGDFHLAAGMVADVAVQGFDRCNAIHAAGKSGQFVLNGEVPAQVRALPFVTDREQLVAGSLRPLPGDGYATVSNPAAGSFTIQRFDAYGNTRGAATHISLDSAAIAPAATPLAHGDVLATWLGPATDPEVPLGQHHPLMVQRFAEDGTAQGMPVQVALTQPFGSRIVPPSLPQAAALADGGAALVWVQVEAGNLNVYLQRFAPDGSTSGGPQRVSLTGPGGLPNVVGLAGNRVLVAWGTGALFARVFEADGTAGPQQAIDPSAASLFGPPQLAALANGGAAVAWSKQIIRFSLVSSLALGPDGAPAGTEQILGDGSMPAVAGLADGQFVVAWTIDNVFARRFAADGTPLTPTAVINLETARANQTSAVALPWGGFLVGWHGTADGHEQDVMRFFDAQGLLGT
jgi:hypothetical protein